MNVIFFLSMLKVYKEKQRDLGIKNPACLGSVQITGGGKGCSEDMIEPNISPSSRSTTRKKKKKNFRSDNVSFYDEKF